MQGIELVTTDWSSTGRCMATRERGSDLSLSIEKVSLHRHRTERNIQ